MTKIIQAALEDIDRIKAVAGRYKTELGFILRPALAEAVNRKELLYHPESGAFCHYHKRRDGITTIYEICVPTEFQRQGIGRQMINQLDRPVQLKCPVDNESNKFYQASGFELVETLPGKKRELNLWRLDRLLPELIFCADGNARFATIAVNHGFKYGAQLPRKIYLDPYFVDQKWRKPDFTRYMAALKHYRPALASVLDWEHWYQYPRVMWWAACAARYVTEAIIIIPKVPGSIPFIPRRIGDKEVRLGYSVKTGFSGTLVPPQEFLGWPIHLLGGSPEKQMALSGLRPLSFGEDVPKLNVVSVDCNYHMGQATRYNQFWRPGDAYWAKNRYWPTLKEADRKKWGDGSRGADAPYQAFERSCRHIMAAWQSLAS